MIKYTLKVKKHNVESEFDFIVSKLGESQSIDDSLTVLVKEQLGNDRNLEWIKTRTNSYVKDTIFCALVSFDEVVCVNFFTPFMFFSNSAEILGHQSGFSATRNNWKGMGLWPTLMKEAELFLIQLNSKFIFGFPNSVSFPVFTRKLNYISELFKIEIFSRLFLRAKTFTKRGRFLNEEYGEIFSNDYDDLLNWHCGQDESQIVYEIDSIGGTKIWGKKRILKFGLITINYLEIGGVKFDNYENMSHALYKILKRNGLFFAVQLKSRNSQLSHLSLFEYNYKNPFVYRIIDSKWKSINEVFFNGANRDAF